MLVQHFYSKKYATDLILCKPSICVISLFCWNARLRRYKYTNNVFEAILFVVSGVGWGQIKIYKHTLIVYSTGFFLFTSIKHSHKPLISRDHCRRDFPKVPRSRRESWTMWLVRWLLTTQMLLRLCIVSSNASHSETMFTFWVSFLTKYFPLLDLHSLMGHSTFIIKEKILVSIGTWKC